jgi:hypothetical protein
MVLARYGAGGQRRWVEYWTDSRRNVWYGDGVAVESGGTVAVAVGVRRGGPLAKDDVIVARFDRRGNRKTFRVLQGDAYQTPAGVAAGLTGGVFVAGTTNSTKVHTLEGETTPTGLDGFLVKYGQCSAP